MRITLQSVFTGKKHTRTINLTREQWNALKPNRRTVPIFKLFPHLTQEEVEFLIFGATEAEWETHFFTPKVAIIYCDPRSYKAKRKLHAR